LIVLKVDDKGLDVNLRRLLEGLKSWIE